MVLTHKEVNQAHLERVIRALFPKYEVKLNERKTTKIKSPETGSFLELDIWIPQLQLAFEFQDIYHYTATWDSQIPLYVVKQKDGSKLESATQLGETLVLVPCWWDGSSKTLSSTIHFHRPDLCRPRKLVPHDPIPINPPFDLFKYGTVPDVGELMLASFPLHSQFINEINPLNTWWIGEKYDGIRICWNPRRSALYSRTGTDMVLPSIFGDNIPNYFLDGELWLGRGNFTDTQRVMLADTSPLLSFLRIIAFDAPHISLRKTPFETRFSNLLANIHYEHPFTNTANRMFCTTAKQFQNMVQVVLESGGEGLIVRKPKSLYERGRSPLLLKIKASRGDREAVVVSVLRDSVYKLKLPDDTIFKVFRHNFKYNIRPKVGDIVTFSYDNYSHRSIPVKPRIFRIRTDVAWEEIVENYKKDLAAPALLNEPSQKIARYQIGRWNSSERGKDMRNLLEKIATRLHLNPIVPETWYSITRKEVENVAGARAVIAHFGGSFVEALFSLFPDIGLEKSKFYVLPTNYWKDVKNRRKIFEKFAKLKKFDPLIPENWYSWSKSDLLTVKGAKSFFRIFKEQFAKTVQNIFPEVAFIESNFVNLPRKYWENEDNRRKFFTDFSRVSGFDALQEENWYFVDKAKLLKLSGAAQALKHYNDNLVRALVALFPHFDGRRFPSLPYNFWQNENNRRNFFISFAKEKSFDPFIPENWYSVQIRELIQTKGGKIVMNFHRKSLFEALHYLFPDIALDEFRFESQPVGFWQDGEKGRQFFVNFAKDHFFEPLVPENWYSVKNEDVLSRPGANILLGFYNNNFVKALVDLFPNIPFEVKRFSGYPYNHWQQIENRRVFFENVAKEKGFDALQPHAWYNLPRDCISSFKGGNSVLSFHRGSLAEALPYLFKEVEWDISKFSTNTTRL